MRLRLAAVLLVLGIGLLAAPPATAQPDLSGSVTIDEPNGFPGICDAPCFSARKDFEVYLAGNPSAPQACPQGDNLYVYTLTFASGAGVAFPPVIELEVGVADAATNVSSAGFVPGPLDPSATTIDTVQNVVRWDFQAPVIALGQTSSLLFVCSRLLPGRSRWRSSPTAWTPTTPPAVTPR